MTRAEFCRRDPSAGLSRFRSLRCARFRHCGSPGPWSLRPRPELSSVCQFPASPESILLSPAYPLPFLLLSLGESGQPLPRSPSDRRRPYPRQRHGPDSANSFSGASPGAARPGLVRAVERVVRRKKLDSGPKQKALSEVWWWWGGVLVSEVDGGWGRYLGKKGLNGERCGWEWGESGCEGQRSQSRVRGPFCFLFLGGKNCAY